MPAQRRSYDTAFSQPTSRSPPSKHHKEHEKRVNPADLLPDEIFLLIASFLLVNDKPSYTTCQEISARPRKESSTYTTRYQYIIPLLFVNHKFRNKLTHMVYQDLDFGERLCYYHYPCQRDAERQNSCHQVYTTLHKRPDLAENVQSLNVKGMSSYIELVEILPNLKKLQVETIKKDHSTFLQNCGNLTKLESL
jgi:hypothetical protein